MVIIEWVITTLLFLLLIFIGFIVLISFLFEHVCEIVKFTFNKIRVIIIPSTNKRNDYDNDF